ncbi:MAG: DUF2797 domain-containing protein [Gammaproteobacteria bacterium]|nr:DUF2797 domain-containing protein [Gammaproteobacteria bacterium]
MSGHLRKMTAELTSPVAYYLPLDDERVPLASVIGKSLRLSYTGAINCIACGRKTNKSFSQGYCFPCMRSLAECDSCIVRPEQCHFDKGTCRDEQWGLAHCMQDHIVYLANSSGVKVGITRHTQVPTRWIDQGATQALPIFRVKDRYTSGLLEVILKNHVADKTDWRKMLKGQNHTVDLVSKRDALVTQCDQQIAALASRRGDGSVDFLSNEPVVMIDFPVNEYPLKITSLNFDKQPDLGGVLLGIKGQYLIFDVGVLNIRKFAGYEVELTL